MADVGPIIFTIVILGVILWLFVIVGEMAVERGRSRFGWVIIALIINPILAMIALAVVGDTHERYEERKLEEDGH